MRKSCHGRASWFREACGPIMARARTFPASPCVLIDSNAMRRATRPSVITAVPARPDESRWCSSPRPPAGPASAPAPRDPGKHAPLSSRSCFLGLRPMVSDTYHRQRRGQRGGRASDPPPGPVDERRGAGVMSCRLLMRHRDRGYEQTCNHSWCSAGSSTCRRSRSDVRFREIHRLRRRYGPGHWVKRKGWARVCLGDGTICLAEIRWYEAHGIERILEAE